ncbi:MAG: HAMP domain-containing histidine kinase [Candidatus Nomurabacteria bacterium]|nr:HAMP domain-containing histidine kinase [Candidatus Nomurabacteria bacterium]
MKPDAAPPKKPRVKPPRQKPGIFDKATLKLTGLCAGILLIICVGFSTAIYATTSRELNRPYNRPPTERIVQLPDGQFNEIFARRVRSVNGDILARLIFINILVLVAGIFASYALARWTLRPIQKAMEKQAEFVSGASHELRTPLSAMQLENEVLLRDQKVSRADLLGQVKSNLEEVGKLRKLTDVLLKLSGDETLPLDQIDAADAVRAAAGRIEKSAGAKKITIQNEVKSLPAHSNLDALTEILAALLDNAVKYSPAESTILAQSDGRKISVSDQGQGIAPKDLDKIFDRFYRADKARSTDGFGLGLSLARRLAGEIGADLSAANRSDQTGAVFTLTLP